MIIQANCVFITFAITDLETLVCFGVDACIYFEQSKALVTTDTILFGKQKGKGQKVSMSEKIC